MFQVRSQISRVLRPLMNNASRHVHNERKVDLGNGTKINIVESGQGEKSVLLMPGALGTAWTDFKPQIEKLPELLPDHTIIAWDPPGYGKSQPPLRKFSTEYYKDDARCAVELMNALKRPKFSVVGWSDGGITGLIMAARYADCIEKLVLWGAGAYLNENEMKALEDIRDVQKWSPRMREPMEKIYGAENFAKLWASWVDAAVAIYKQCDGDYCRKELEQVKVPTFILHGKKDPMIAPEHIPYLKQHLHGCKYYEFPEGKHNIHLRYADEFNKLVADFLQDKS